MRRVRVEQAGSDSGSSDGGPVDLLAWLLDELETRETRLLATGVGDHVPYEVLVNLQQLRLERARLLARALD